MVIKVGTEFLVNTQTDGRQGSPTITSLANGNFVITWHDNGALSDANVKAQIFSPSGAKIGAEFLINTQTSGSQQSPTIAGLTNGEFVVTWTDNSGTLGDTRACRQLSEMNAAAS